jgi:NodT family efflux transporter outer membrane factor (OMF) lipoprotein
MRARLAMLLILSAAAGWGEDRFRQTAEGTTAERADLASWWSRFGDSELESLVARAVANNTDLRIAAARVEEARALAKGQRSTLLPSVGWTNSFERVRGVVGQGTALPGLADSNAFQAGFDASWELDFFGGNRKAARAAAEDAGAAGQALRDAQLRVVAEVARAYVELRGLDQRLEITRKNIRTQQDTLDLTLARAEAGRGTELDVERQRAQLASTAAAEPLLDSLRVAGVNRLAVLIGERPGTLDDELRAERSLPSIPAVVAVGFPSDLLSRRPDVRETAAVARAAANRVGAARADLFPKFVITGLSGRQSSDLGGFTLGAGNFFAFGPGIRLPIFSGGRIRANIAASDARLQEALAAYDGTVLKAVEDVETALAAYGREQQRRERLEKAVGASRLATDLANELYTKGLADFLSVLDAQRAQYLAEEDLVESRTAVVNNLVALFKALGGGW